MRLLSLFAIGIRYVRGDLSSQLKLSSYSLFATLVQLFWRVQVNDIDWSFSQHIDEYFSVYTLKRTRSHGIAEGYRAFLKLPTMICPFLMVCPTCESEWFGFHKVNLGGVTLQCTGRNFRCDPSSFFFHGTAGCYGFYPYLDNPYWKIPSILQSVSDAPTTVYQVTPDRVLISILCTDAHFLRPLRPHSSQIRLFFRTIEATPLFCSTMSTSLIWYLLISWMTSRIASSSLIRCRPSRTLTAKYLDQTAQWFKTDAVS